MARIIPARGAVEEAAERLSRGELVAIPTETVYGLAADATNGEAVARIFEAKNRPRFNPLIAHVADRAMAERIARFDALSSLLADRFWPGPLTLVLPLKAGSRISSLVTAGLDTIAVRMPVGVARDIAARLDRPLAAPSANPSGKLSATTAAAVEAGLGDRISLIVDGGAARIGVESTIVRVADGQLTLLRPGGVPAEDIEAATGKPVRRSETGAAVEAPGMLASHYAPAARLRLEIASVRPGEALLAFGPHRANGVEKAMATRNLSAGGDLREAAANLFAHLHELDASGAATIAVEPVPGDGLGAAINDRLARAAAPREPVVAGNGAS
ncbi:MAG: L-threonylcarbamoyladenylate synthase [Rhizobiaceae bacterium]